jgi:hypothetical protein
MPDPAVVILPYHMRLGRRPARIALDDLTWPLGQPERLRGKTLRDLEKTDHLIIYPRDTMHTRLTYGTKARVSVMVLEPAAIHGHHFRLLRWSWWRFYRVLTIDEALLKAIPNGVFFPFGDTWVKNWQTLDRRKSKTCSLIASSKRSQTGHVLRHDIADWVRETGQDVDLMGGGYAPFEEKSDGLAPYRYSLVIENVRERNYFTEKLMDALLCQTVPIYWGCPNIEDFIDTSGMIICETADDIRRAVNTMSEADYAARLPALIATEERAAYWGDYLTRAARAVLEDAPAQA